MLVNVWLWALIVLPIAACGILMHIHLQQEINVMTCFYLGLQANRIKLQNYNPIVSKALHVKPYCTQGNTVYPYNNAAHLYEYIIYI